MDEAAIVRHQLEQVGSRLGGAGARALSHYLGLEEKPARYGLPLAYGDRDALSHRAEHEEVRRDIES